MVNQWDLYFCSLDPTQGSEQKGTRPVLVISNNATNHALPVSTVLPLSSMKQGDKIYPTEIFLSASETGLPKDSVAMIQQVCTVAHARFGPLVGWLKNEGSREEIREGLRLYFEL